MSRASLAGALALAFALPTLPASTAAAWEHNIADWPVERFPLPIIVRPEPTRDTSNEELAAIVEEVIETWNAVTCSYAVLEYAGVQDVPILIDDQQVFGWEDDPEVWVYGSQSAGATIIDVLGENGPRIDIAFNDINFDWVVGANTLVLPDYEFGVDPNLEVDPASVITHEAGHLLGLAHPRVDDPESQPDNGATMVFALLPNAQQATLAGDDKIGLCEKYPVEDGDECVTDEDCAGDDFCRTFSAGFGEVALCEERRGQIGEFCGLLDYNCAGICLFLTADFSEGYCTDYCETNDDCPEDLDDGWICVSLPTTAGTDVQVCQPDDGSGGIEADVGIVESDSDISFTPVEEEADARADAPDNEDVAPTSDVGADAEGSGDTEGGSGGGCASAGSAASSGPLLLLATLLLWRRREKGPA